MWWQSDVMKDRRMSHTVRVNLNLMECTKYTMANASETLECHRE